MQCACTLYLLEWVFFPFEQNLIKTHFKAADGERLQIRSDVEDGEIPTKNNTKNPEIVEIGKVNGHIVISESDSDVMSVQNDKRFVHHVQAKKRLRYMIM